MKILYCVSIQKELGYFNLKILSNILYNEEFLNILFKKINIKNFIHN